MEVEAARCLWSPPPAGPRPSLAQACHNPQEQAATTADDQRPAAHLRRHLSSVCLRRIGSVIGSMRLRVNPIPADIRQARVRARVSTRGQARGRAKNCGAGMLAGG
jgi:hypothetical protein